MADTKRSLGAKKAWVTRRRLARIATAVDHGTGIARDAVEATIANLGVSARSKAAEKAWITRRRNAKHAAASARALKAWKTRRRKIGG